MVSRHWLYLGGFVLTGLSLVGAGLMGTLDALSVLAGDGYAGEGFVLLAMLDAAAEWIVAMLGLGVLAVVFLVATVVSVLRSVSLPRSDWLASRVRWLERRSPFLAQFDVARRVEPTTEARKRNLEERYLRGELSESEFERELERLLEDTSSANPRQQNFGSTELEK